MNHQCIIVVPCYNEARRIPIGIFEQFVNAHGSIKFIFVDDGSNDDSLKLIQELQNRNPVSIDVISVDHAGKSSAVRQGVLRAFPQMPDWIGYWDADLSTPLEAILDFRAILKTNEMVQLVFGARVKLLGRKIERGIFRHYPGRVFATMVSMLLDLGIYDSQCGAKLFRATPQIKAGFESPFITTWTFDVEFLARLKQIGEIDLQSSIYEFPLQEWKDVSGTKIKLTDIPGTLVDLGKIYWKYLRPATRNSG